MKKIKSIHFVGIKGVGMTPLAVIVKEAGFTVTGSDIEEEFITDSSLKKADIVPYIGFSKRNILNVDLVITTGAHGGFNNPEVIAAKERGIKVLTQGEAVGFFMEGTLFNRKFIGISVAGCHGKTTTTAMLATILKTNKLDPSYLIGTSEISSLGQPGHYGKGKYFVAEADEYATEPNFDKTAKFLWQHPEIGIFTNIELDHLDLYKSVEEVEEVFSRFANQISRSGVLIAYGDNEHVQKVLKKYQGRVITYGNSPRNDFVIKKVHVSSEQTFFWVESKGTNIGEFVINVPGEHNAQNALAAIIAGFELGLKLEQVKKGLVAFKGSKRRFEYIGETEQGSLVFDDYAHHPTEIKKTLAMIKQSFPKHKLICIFQPHTYSRTKLLFDDFIYSFVDCDQVIITNIYASSREKTDSTISSQLLVNRINNFYNKAIFLPKLEDVIEYFKLKKNGRNVLIVSMGAGDIYKVSQQLLKI